MAQQKKFPVTVAAEPLAVNLDDAARMVGTPRWTVEQAILLGQLKAKWAGRQRIIPLRNLRDWISSLDDVEPSNAPSVLRRKAHRTTLPG